MIASLSNPVGLALRGGSAFWVRLFAGGYQGDVWFYAPSKWWQERDGSRVTPAGVGDPVGEIVGIVNGISLKALTDAGRPIHRVDGSGYHYLETDGSDDSLKSAASLSLQLPYYVGWAGSKQAQDALVLFGVKKSSTDYAQIVNVTSNSRLTGGLRESAIGSAVVNSAANAVPVSTIKVADCYSVVGTTDLGVNGGAPLTVANSWLAGTVASGMAVGISMTISANPGGTPQYFYSGIVINRDITALRSRLVTELGKLGGLTL